MSSSPAASTVPTFARPGSVPVEAAARQLVRAATRGDSAFTPGIAIWTASHVAELEDRFVNRPDVSGNNFDEKLGKQLDGVSDGARQLFAELFYLNLLPLMNYMPATKRTLIASVLNGMATPVLLPEDLDSALDSGVFSGGVASKTRRYWQLCLLIKVAGALAALAPYPRSRVFADPLEFRTFLSGITQPNEPSQRQSLLYLTFPGYFLPILKETHRKAIRDAFIDYIEAPTGDLDEELHLIYVAIADHEGSPVDFYLPQWREKWDPMNELGDDASDALKQRAWLVRGNSVNGKDLVPSWLGEGRVSLAATNLREVQPGINRDDLKPIVDADYAHASYAAKAEKLDEFHAFLSRMQVGDLIATVRQGRVHLGVITGGANYHATIEGDSNLLRQVSWSGSADGVDYGDLPGEVAARLKVQRDVLDMTQQLEALTGLLAAETTQMPPPTVERVMLCDATPELAAHLHVEQTWLQECIDLLNDRPQLIFYGPPGTGKTYIALDLAKHVAGDNVRLVQFHPSYSYEDFFEGFRPAPEGGFVLKPGPMRRIVDQAVANPTVPHVLIIDEINRGNLAKVFGELYFLLEYRDNNVELLYAADDFSLPKNVYIIGTMNTADRSIALVDAAMRRRFAFLPLHPSEKPTSEVLRAWLKGQGRPAHVADLLDELNARIADPDFKIGPSYFMRDAIYGDAGLERTWRTSILPLLEEHHFGELSGAQVADRYGLAAIAARVDRAHTPAVNGVENETAADAPPSAD